MAEPITAAQFAQAKALDEKATPGPWGCVGDSRESHICADDERVWIADMNLRCERWGFNEQFIYQARTSLPAAIAWIEAAVPLLEQAHIDSLDQHGHADPEIKALIAGFPPCPAPPER